MKRLLVLGAGTAGTMAVNKLRPKLSRERVEDHVVDPSDTHYYQPGYLFIPFGIYQPDEVVKPTSASSRPVSSWSGRASTGWSPTPTRCCSRRLELPYDYLIIATGTTPRPGRDPRHGR
jgi:sulfide:quinone oxidoreductase